MKAQGYKQDKEKEKVVLIPKNKIHASKNNKKPKNNGK